MTIFTYQLPVSGGTLFVSFYRFLLLIAEQAAAFTGGAADAIARLDMHDDIHIVREMSFEVGYYFIPDSVRFAYG